MLQVQNPAVFFHDGITDGEAETASVRLGREIRIEDIGCDFVRDPAAGVGDRDF